MRNVWEFINLWFVRKAGFWTAIFTGVLTFVTIQIERTYKVINQTSISSERAFLTFVGPQNGPKLVDNSGAWSAQEVSVVWSNAGNTAARMAVIKIKGDSFFPDIPEQYDFPLGTEKTTIVLGPKSTYGVNTTIPKEILADAWHSKKRIFLWGTVIYDDVFPASPERLSEFCAELTHLSLAKQLAQTTPPPGPAPAFVNPTLAAPKPSDIDDPGAVLGTFQWQQCHAHNCYDEDCPDYKDRIADMRK